MSVPHNTLTSSDLHEPKGAADASSGQVYVANGTGSGSWLQAYSSGSEDYQDTGTAQTLGVGYANRTILTNNGLGSLSTSENRLPGKTAIYDTSSNEFDFDGAGYVIGDQLVMRVDLSFTTGGANHEITVGADLAIGSGVDYTFRPFNKNYKTAGTYTNQVIYLIFDIGNTSTLTYPAQLFAYSDNSGDTVDVNGWRVFVTPRTPVFA